MECLNALCREYGLVPWSWPIFIFLSFLQDEILTVIRRIDSNWAEGKLGDKIGIFPISFVEVGFSRGGTIDPNKHEWFNCPNRCKVEIEIGIVGIGIAEIRIVGIIWLKGEGG